MFFHFSLYYNLLLALPLSHFLSDSLCLTFFLNFCLYLQLVTLRLAHVMDRLTKYYVLHVSIQIAIYSIIAILTAIQYTPPYRGNQNVTSPDVPHST